MADISVAVPIPALPQTAVTTIGMALVFVRLVQLQRQASIEFFSKP
jgi:hypothetical protein